MRSPTAYLLATALFCGLPVLAQSDRPTGKTLTGLPAVNFDADEGFGYGALLQFYDYGTEGVAPYRYSLQPTVFFTSRGRRDVILFVDAPHILPGGWRFNGAVAREQQLATPFYGVGNNSVVDTNATKGANPYFYRFGRTVLRANGDLQHSVGISSLRFLVGTGTRGVTVRTVPYDSGTTLLAQTLGKQTLPERRTTYARVGLVFDTRDREIGPSSGNWSEVLVQRAGRIAGGDEVFTRITGNIRQYVPLTSSLTFAERVVLQTTRGELPVTDLSIVQSSFRDDEALGGASSIRGIPRNRYVGKGVAFANSELRWSASTFNLLGHSTRLVLSGFVDAGRVWDKGFDASTIAEDLHAGYGGGVHLAIGPTFVVTGDVGHSSQSTAAIYLGIGYLF